MNEALQGGIPWLNAAARLGGTLRVDEGQAASTLARALEAEPPRCPRCRGLKLYRLSVGGHRCPACRYSFQEHSGRWIGRHRLAPRVWLAVLRGFDLGLQVQELSRLTGLSMPTASRVHRTVQLSLAALDPAWTEVVRAIVAGEPVKSRFRARSGASGLRVEVLPKRAQEPPLELPPPGRDDAAMRRFRNGLRGWKRLIPERLALTVKELEVRASLQVPLFEVLLDALTRFMPPGLEPWCALEAYALAGTVQDGSPES